MTQQKVLVSLEFPYGVNEDEDLILSHLKEKYENENIKVNICTFSVIDLEKRIFKNVLNECSIAILEWMQKFFNYCNESLFNIKEQIVVTNVSFFKILNIIDYLYACGCFTPMVKDYLTESFNKLKSEFVKNIDRTIEYVYLDFVGNVFHEQNHFVNNKKLEKIKLFHKLEKERNTFIIVVDKNETTLFDTLFDMELFFKYYIGPTYLENMLEEN